MQISLDVVAGLLRDELCGLAMLVQEYLLVKGESCSDLGTALPCNPALVEGHDLLAETPLGANFPQEFPSPQKPCSHICNNRFTSNRADSLKKHHWMFAPL